MGVRKGDIGTGKSPAFKDKLFVKQCQELFLYQLEIQRPEIILVLGKHVAEFLAPTAEQLNGWQRIRNFSEVDSAGSQVKSNVVFTNGIVASLALLTHPSFRPLNVHRRSFQGETNSTAEIKMIQAIF
jgi:uracil-DNA glycosylase